MFVRGSVGFACLLQILGAAFALPTEQKPLSTHDSKSVQAVRAEYVAL